jgi:hypothetical protein
MTPRDSYREAVALNFLTEALFVIFNGNSQSYSFGFPPPLCRRSRRPTRSLDGIGRGFNSPERSEDYWTRVRYPDEPLAPDRSGDAGRPVPPVEHRRRWRAAGGDRRALAEIITSPSNHAGNTTPAEWRTRGRAASPTKRGRYCLDLNEVFQMRYFRNGTSQSYQF